MTRRGPSVALVGFMASGKSTVGRVLARKLGYPFVETDENVEALAGCSIPEIFAREGEQGFRDYEVRVIQQVARPGRVIATGGGAVLRAENRHALKRSGYMVHLSIQPATVMARTSGTRSERPLLNVDDPLARVKSLMEERQHLYAEAHLTLAVDDRSPEDLAEAIMDWYRRQAGGGAWQA